MKIVKVSGMKVAEDADVVAARLSRVASDVRVRLGAADDRARQGAGAAAQGAAGAGVRSGFGSSVATFDGEATLDEMNQALEGTPYRVSDFDVMSD